jgi:hypothetical protein
MKRNLKLSLLTSLSLSLFSTAFAAGVGTAADHVLPGLSFNPDSLSHQEQVAAIEPSTTWNPTTVYCIAEPSNDIGNKFTRALLGQIRSAFATVVTAVFQQARINMPNAEHVTMFTDNDMTKYQANLQKALQILAAQLKPFWADIYSPYLFMVIQAADGTRKHISFIPDSPMRYVSVNNLAQQGMDVVNLEDLPTYVSNLTVRTRILRSHLVARTGTHGLISQTAQDINNQFHAKGLDPIQPYMDSPIGHVTLATIQTGFSMNAVQAQALVKAVQDARTALRPNNGTPSRLSFTEFKVTAVDPTKGGHNARSLLSGQFN